MTRRDSYDIHRHAKFDPRPPLRFGLVKNQAGGAIAQPWNPGTYYCTLTPCTDFSGATLTGAPDVQVVIQHPFNAPASFFGALVGAVLAYIPMDMGEFTVAGQVLQLVGVLLSPPIPPTGQQYASALENQSGTPTEPNYQAAYQKIHG